MTFQEGNNPPEIDTSQGMVYEPVQGEKIHILFWVRYPSYDFIFGVPDKENPKHEKEIGFYQYRDTRAKKIMQGAYFDIEEVEEMIEGFKRILEFSIEHSSHLWTQRITKKD